MYDYHLQKDKYVISRTVIYKESSHKYEQSQVVSQSFPQEPRRADLLKYSIIVWK